MKVLLGVATYPEEPAVYAATQASLEALRFTGELVVRLYALDDPKVDPKDNITAKHNRMRQDALDGEYDTLFMVEADMIVPPDSLELLASVDADVVYAPYCSRHHPMLLTFPVLDGYKGRSLSADEAEWRDKFGTVITSEGVGFGCTLIRRQVLEQVEFRRDTSTRFRRQFADDWTFALDVKAAGFASATHLGVLCGHIQRDGGVRWVDPDAPGFLRIVPEDGSQTSEGKVSSAAVAGRYRVRKWLFGPARSYAPGTEIDLDAEAAAVLTALGKVEQL